jgi:hypothetical protein
MPSFPPFRHSLPFCAALAFLSVSCQSRRGDHGDFAPIVESAPLPRFSRVEIASALTAEIVRAEVQQVEYLGPASLRSAVKIRVEDDTLFVTMTRSKYRDGSPKIRISTPTLSSIELSGASDAQVRDFSAPTLKVSLHGASDIRMGGHVDALELNVSGASEAKLADLVVADASIYSSGASDVEVHVERSLRAHASGASEIAYRGVPQSLERSTSGASQIYRMDQ